MASKRENFQEQCRTEVEILELRLYLGPLISFTSQNEMHVCILHHKSSSPIIWLMSSYYFPFDFKYKDSKPFGHIFTRGPDINFFGLSKGW